MNSKRGLKPTCRTSFPDAFCRSRGPLPSAGCFGRAAATCREAPQYARWSDRGYSAGASPYPRDAQRQGLRRSRRHDIQPVAGSNAVSSAQAVARKNFASNLPALIAGAGDRAALRFLEYFTVNIRNKNTRAAYARAAADFLNWCEGQGISELGRVQPVHVAAYIELLQGKRSAPTVKQHLACIRMLFDWLVIGQVMPTNPAHSVRGPRHSVTKGFNAGAVVGRSNRAAHRHGCFNRRGSARPRHHRRDDVHLRPRRGRRRAHRRGLLFAEETLVAPAPRKKR